MCLFLFGFFFFFFFFAIYELKKLGYWSCTICRGLRVGAFRMNINVSKYANIDRPHPFEDINALLTGQRCLCHRPSGPAVFLVGFPNKMKL